MRKLLILSVVMAMSFSTTGCEMDGASMEMLMSFVGGFAGFDGSAFGSGTNSQGNQSWAAAGSQMRDMWMSQSDNNQQGRAMTSMLQANQIASNYSSSVNRQNQANMSQAAQNLNGSGSSQQSSTQQTSAQQSGDKGGDKSGDKSLWDKASDRLNNLSSSDMERIIKYGSKLTGKGDKS